MEKAAWGISTFFAGEIISRLIGAIIPNWIKPRVFLLLTALTALHGVFVFPTFTVELDSIFIIGFGVGNMFPIIFLLSLEKMTDRTNEISSIPIMHFF